MIMFFSVLVLLCSEEFNSVLACVVGVPPVCSASCPSCRVLHRVLAHRLEFSIIHLM
jgi:hypothetical protein